MLNALFNTLAYQPPAASRATCSGASWLAHIADSLTDRRTRSGPIVRGTVHGDLPGAATCSRRRSQSRRRRSAALIDLLNAPDDARSTRPTARPRQRVPRSTPMNRQAPSTGRIADDGRVRGVVHRAAAVPVDLVRRHDAAQPRRATASASSSTRRSSSAAQADVRISGVNVGKVVSVGLDRRTGLTRAVIQIDPQFAPRPADTRAILRQKTLLGRDLHRAVAGLADRAASCPTAGRLPQGQVAPTVELDQILSTFDPATRQRVRDLDAAAGRSRSPAGARTSTPRSPSCTRSRPTSTRCWRCSPRQRGDQHAAARRRPGAVGGQRVRRRSSRARRNANAVFSATAAQDVALAATIRAFPRSWSRRGRRSTASTQFARTTKPLIDELRPAAVQLTPALESMDVLAPELRTCSSTSAR